MTPEELEAHCELLEKLLANYVSLITTSRGQERLAFEARAALVRWELEELCRNRPDRSQKTAA